MSQLCPCGSATPYSVCCEPYLSGQAAAPTAEALMRSRYTAFCKGNLDYLVATHHPDRRQVDERLSLHQTLNETSWVSLTVISTQKGQPQDTTGQVEFMAVYRAPELGQLHERSRFVKANGRWFYFDGKRLPPLLPKRNQPCWCGSGKKFKQCHA
ncbi:MAG: YchJ family protein [Leptolyngbya sp. SIO4C1]|nr:YchJ family protein [Leptolyngbya sp. SIO4C1]